MSGPEPQSNASRPDARPLVARAVSNRGIWAFGACMVVGAGALFAALEDHRATLETPSISAMGEPPEAVVGSSPDLVVPPAYEAAQAAPFGQPAPRADPFATGQRENGGFYRPLIQPQIAITTPRLPQFAQNQFSASPSGSRTTDTDYDARPVRPAKAEPEGNGDKAGERVEARRFLNPTTTVPKGTIVQAVLETALDSTRAGFARAIVSRDVYGFDGKRVLVPKGSRLIGDYKADLTDGQSRALIQWDRLTRPDGVIINLDSPSADPLGRAGVKGKVNSHFFAKFGGAILQSALDVGSQVATNKIASGGTVVYALPGISNLRGVAQSNGLAAQDRIQPTLTVKQGTSVSVFVARDLDFTSVEQ